MKLFLFLLLSSGKRGSCFADFRSAERRVITRGTEVSLQAQYTKQYSNPGRPRVVALRLLLVLTREIFLFLLSAA